jgi:mono/diheme cytochrome c family protein
MKNSLVVTLFVLLIACSDQEQAMSKQVLDRGMEIYLDACAVCHGINGNGEGVALPALNTKPKSISMWSEKYDIESFVFYVTHSTEHPAFNSNFDYEAIFIFSGAVPQ